jgi:hypothetical protein
MTSDGRSLWHACNRRVARNALDVEGLEGLEVGGGCKLGQVFCICDQALKKFVPRHTHTNKHTYIISEAPTAGSSTALGAAAVPEEAPSPAESMSRAAPAAGGARPRYTYQSLSIATNNFERSGWAAEGVGQSFKECWGRVRLLL